MKKAPRRPTVAKRKKKDSQEISPAEVETLEQISKRYAQAENAWLKMNAPLDSDETWAHVEDKLQARSNEDSSRRWKYFSK